VIDLIIEGYTETINNYKWTVELACSPAQPWLIGTYDDSTYRYDAVAVTDAAYSSTERKIGIIVDSQLGFYSYLSAPYNVKIAGQLNRVLGASAPNSVDIADGTFETLDPVTGAGWFATGATSSVPVRVTGGHRGTYAAQITTSGSPSQTILRQQGLAYSPVAAPGQSFTVTGFVKCSVARNVTMTLDYLNSGGAWFASSSTTVAVAANTWTQISISATAPANTAYIQYGPTMASSPANGTVLTIDDVTAWRTDVNNGRQLIATDRGIDGFSKALPAGASFRIATPARYGL